MSSQADSLYNPHLGMPAHEKSVAEATTDMNNQFPTDPSQINYFTILFYLLLSSMQIRQDTVVTQSKEIDINASLQNKLNNLNAQIKFAIGHSKETNATINSIETKNQQFAALRENIQNNLITLRQVAEVDMTSTSTNVNLLQQDASEDSGWLHTLNTIFQVLDEITQR